MGSTCIVDLPDVRGASWCRRLRNKFFGLRVGGQLTKKCFHLKYHGKFHGGGEMSTHGRQTDCPPMTPVLQKEPRLACLRPVAAWGVGCLCLSAQTVGEVIQRVDRSQRDQKMWSVCCDEGRWCPMECGARETDPRFSENPLSIASS